MRRTEWAQLQTQRISRLLIHAGRNVPYYRRIFATAGLDPENARLPQDIQRLPLLTKETIRQFPDALFSDNLDQGQLYRNATGGSTGVPLTFFQDQSYRDVSTALDAYVCSWWGIRPYDRTAAIWGADREFKDLSWQSRFYNWRHRTRSLNAFRLSDESLESFCKCLVRWKPPYLIGYATALDRLAKFAIHRDYDLRFRAIRSSAETLFSPQRDTISRAFDSPVFDFYGSREVNNLAAECPEEHSLHAISTWRYIEIVDDDGQPVTDGELGRVVVTDLSNFGMPFIRYCNDDLAIKMPDYCPCGRPSPVLGKLCGRQTDLIAGQNGELIHGEWFTHLFYDTKHISKFQIYQPAVDKLIIRYVPLGDGCNSEIARIAELVTARLGAKVTVSSECLEVLPVPASGKHRFTISEVQLD